MTDDWSIEAVGLEKSYGTVRVLDGIDLRVRRGEVFALLGPNGAGKTTTVRILATLTRPDGGQARVAGLDIVRDRTAVRPLISLTGQYAAVDEHQTGEENLQLIGRLAGLTRAQAHRRCDELIDRFDLAKARGRRVTTYSGGMRRRLDLAAGLLTEPAVIFLDEPTTGLDPRSRQAVWDVVSGLADSGVTIFLTTQYLEEADQLADRIAVLDGGRIVATGTPAHLKSQVGEERLDLTLTDQAAFDAVTRRLGSRAVDSDVSRLHIAVATDGSAAHVRSLLDELDPQGDAVSRFAIHSATLDDVFLALTGHASTTPEKETAHV